MLPSITDKSLQMKNRFPFFLGILFFFAFYTNPLLAQTADSTTIWQITMMDDNEFIGHILEETETIIEFKTATIGIITLRKDQIKRREKLRSDGSTNGLLWAENRMAYRYFIRNSGYNLKKGEAVYQNAWILVNNLDVGLTDNFSIGLGTVPIFLFGGGTSPIWLTPRLSIPVEADKVNLGVGALVGTTVGNDFDNSSFGFGFGNVTLGDRNQNITLGVGYGFFDGEFADRPTFNVSGMLRTGKRSYLISENYIISAGNETIVALSLGGRFTGKRIVLDYGGYFVPNLGTFAIAPWLSVSIPFGNARN